MDHPHDFWRSRRVLVTGCTGFLGTWVVRHLLDAGTDVTGLIRDRTTDAELIRDRLVCRVRVVRGRVEDVHRLKQTVAIRDIDTIFHLAGPADDAKNRHTVVDRWLEVVRTAARSAVHPVTVAAPVREGHDHPGLLFADGGPLRTLLVPIPYRTPGPGAARLLLSAVEGTALGSPAAATRRAA